MPRATALTPQTDLPDTAPRHHTGKSPIYIPGTLAIVEAMTRDTQIDCQSGAIALSATRGLLLLSCL